MDKFPKNEGPVSPERRKALKDLLYKVAGAGAFAATVQASLLAEAIAGEGGQPPEPDSWKDIVPDPVHEQGGTWVLVEDIMSQEIPTPDPLAVLGSDKGLVISKRFHRFWLFDEGKLLKTGPVGTGRVKYTNRKYQTPPGSFHVTRQEGENYMSGEYPDTDGEPNMPYSTFFNRGIAFHGSKNYRVFGGKQFMLLDSSHGCANALKEDAQLVYKTLRVREPVAVLP